MTFGINDPVLVIALKKKGIITGQSAKGRYRVAIGNMQIQCSEDELRAVAQKEKKKSKGRCRQGVSEQKQSKSVSLDLHGYSVEEALKQTEQTLSDALLDGCDRVEIIHGIGTGKIKAALHNAFSNLKVVKAFKIDADNPGTTWVYL